jgi:hypothetical protein
MRGSRLLMAGLTVSAAALVAACSSDSSASQANHHARRACAVLETLGSQLSHASRTHPFSGAAIDGRLSASQAEAQQAVKLDANTWSDLRDEINSFAAALRAGKAPDPTLVNQLAGRCDQINPLIVKSPTTR